MPRPKKCRLVNGETNSFCFSPINSSASIQNIEMNFEELESLRLADYLCLKQEEAAIMMGVSRQTFGRIVESARKKTATALINKTSLTIEGGAICASSIDFDGKRRRCPHCKNLNRKCSLITNEEISL